MGGIKKEDHKEKKSDKQVDFWIKKEDHKQVDFYVGEMFTATCQLRWKVTTVNVPGIKDGKYVEDIATDHGAILQQLYMGDRGTQIWEDVPTHRLTPEESEK